MPRDGRRGTGARRRGEERQECVARDCLSRIVSLSGNCEAMVVQVSRLAQRFKLISVAPVLDEEL